MRVGCCFGEKIANTLGMPLDWRRRGPVTYDTKNGVTYGGMIGATYDMASPPKYAYSIVHAIGGRTQSRTVTYKTPLPVIFVPQAAHDGRGRWDVCYELRWNPQAATYTHAGPRNTLVRCPAGREPMVYQGATYGST